MIVFDAETNVLDTEIFPQDTIADLNSSITFILLFSRKKSLRWKEIKAHTHTHTHTHPPTHTHTHTHELTDPHTHTHRHMRNLTKYYLRAASIQGRFLFTAILCR